MPSRSPVPTSSCSVCSTTASKSCSPTPAAPACRSTTHSPASATGCAPSCRGTTRAAGSKEGRRRKPAPDSDPPMNLPGYKPYRRATRSELEKLLELLRHSQRPMIYAGGGIVTSGAAPHLRAFAERTSVPVALTLLGLGGFPSEHFLCLQMLGMHGTVYSNYAVNDADLLLALGVRFDDRVTGKVSEFANHGKIFHINIDPSKTTKNKFP